MTSPSAVPRGRRFRITSLTIPANYVFIGAVALALLGRHLGSFVTLDEIDFWLRRSEQFLAALETGDFAATALSTHPGVTTMWLGSLGILLRRGFAATGWLVDQPFPTMLALMRLPVVLAHMLDILAGYGLLHRMLPAATAALAAFLWAVDPFVLGYSRLLHVEALAGTFITLCLLATCLYWHHDSRRRWLIFSGVCAGLAILSKSPSLVLLPTVGLLAIAAAWRPTTNDQRPTTNTSLRRSSLVTTMLPLAVPARLPTGSYRLFIGLYDQASGGRLPLTADDGHSPTLDGPDALLLTQVLLPIDHASNPVEL